MRRRIPASGGPRPGSTGGFSLVEGDPLFELPRAVHLAGGRHRVLPRALTLALIGWLPPLLLALIFGAARGALVPLHTRFLVAIPVLLWAESFVDSRVRTAVASFTERGIVAPADLPRFQAIVTDAERLHHSLQAALAIVALSFGLAAFGGGAGRGVRTWALDGWITFLSLPLFRLVLLQWVWRWTIWAILLGRTARLELCLEPTHPDLAGGLGFLEQAGLAFLSLQVATGAVIAGQLVGHTQPVRQQIAAFSLITAILVLGPLALFSHRLIRAKRHGQIEYGELASRHNRLFDERWFRRRETEPLGDPSISSLADLGTSYGSIDKMRPLPVGRRSLVLIAAICLAPGLPALLARMPLQEMLVRVVKTLVL